MSCGLIALDDLRTLQGIAADDAAQLAVLRLLIAQATARIEKYCRRKFKADDYTEYYQGNGSPWLALRQWPINSVASVYEDNNGLWGQSSDPFPATTLLTAGTDYAIVKNGSDGTGVNGMLFRRTGVWPKWDLHRPGIISAVPTDMPGNIKVTYNAGFETVPADIQQACAYLCASTKRTVILGAPTTSEGWEDYNYSLSAAVNTAFAGLPADTLAILSQYRPMAVG